ncbi:MAG: hypothetical protein HRF47_08650 [Chloroflexota bacterium]|jgi:hypothetical protein
MDEEKKYFGMTRMQVGILAALATVFVLVVCVGAFLVFRNLAPSVSALPQPTATPLPTVTLMAAPSPTVTPALAPTAIPYEQLIPAGWKQYKTSLVEIWLPANFKLGDKKALNQTAQLAFNELFITEIPSKTSTYNMLVSVSYNLLTGDSLDAFLDTQIKQNLPPEIRVTDRRTVYVNTVEARRIMLEYRVNNIDINDMVYVFLDGNTVWYVEYVAQIGEFFENLPIFEQSIKTFRTVKY